jgi:hypothetical protein
MRREINSPTVADDRRARIGELAGLVAAVRREVRRSSSDFRHFGGAADRAGMLEQRGLTHPGVLVSAQTMR